MQSLPQAEKLNTQTLARIFDNMSESYKLFWFKAIVEHVLAGEDEIAFDKLINTMIKNAWYMVSEFKLNLGPADGIEQTVLFLHENSNLKSSEKEEMLVAFLENCQIKEFISLKKRLCKMVPYRLQAPFFPKTPDIVWRKTSAIIEHINSQNGIMYKIEDSNNPLEKRIIISPDWVDYISSNAGILLGWIDYNLITYLQRRNPNVPGIASKIYPPQERKLDKAKKYWKSIIRVSNAITPVLDIYSGKPLSEKDVSIDHFVPWSYVAHDELWNLVPTTKSINSSKSNSLPVWDIYFPRLCQAEYRAYEIVNSSTGSELQRYAKACMKEHINDDEVRHKLYREGQRKEEFSKRLEEVVLPAYEAAKNFGFAIWEYK